VKAFFKLLGLALAAVFIVGLALRLLVLDVAIVDSADMYPTLGRDAWVVVNRKTAPERGDLVMFKKDGAYLVRRVVALPGERLSTHEGRPVVNGHEAAQDKVRTIELDMRYFNVMKETLGGRSYEVLYDTYRATPDRRETRVQGGYFLMADNREHGSDSWDFGPVPADQIRGVLWGFLREGELRSR
jgi:signal peptidase I